MISVDIKNQIKHALWLLERMTKAVERIAEALDKDNDEYMPRV